MNRQELTNKVLQLLAENARNNICPEVMDSETIASKLHVSLVETEQLLKVLNASGMTLSTLEGKYSLITREGLQLLDQITSNAYHFRRHHFTNIPHHP